MNQRVFESPDAALGEAIYSAADMLADVGTRSDTGIVARGSGIYPVFSLAGGEIPSEVAGRFADLPDDLGTIGKPRYELAVGYIEDQAVPSDAGVAWVACISLTKIVSRASGIELRLAVDYLVNSEANMEEPYGLDCQTELDTVVPEPLREHILRLYGFWTMGNSMAAAQVGRLVGYPEGNAASLEAFLHLSGIGQLRAALDETVAGAAIMSWIDAVAFAGEPGCSEVEPEEAVALRGLLHAVAKRVRPA